MKAIRKETKEIVDIISHGGISHTKRSHSDYVKYINKDGVECKSDENFYLDFEPIQEKQIDWEQRTWEAALVFANQVQSTYKSDDELTAYNNFLDENDAVRLAKMFVEEYKMQMDL